MTAEPNGAPFAVVRRGYDRTQVDEALDRLGSEIDEALATRAAAARDRDEMQRRLDTAAREAQATRTATGDMRAEMDRLRVHVSELSTIPSTVDGMSERLQQVVRIAQDEVNDMRTRATAGATQILTLAQAEADELRERSESERQAFEKERAAAEASLRDQLEESRSRLEQLRSDSDGQRERLAADLAERRSQAEDELAGEMEQHRADVLREIAAVEARHRDDATRIVETATREARQRLADATAEAQQVRSEARQGIDAAQRELEEMRSLQHQVSEQLTSVRTLLDWTLPQISAAGNRSVDHDSTPTFAVPAQKAGPAPVGSSSSGQSPAAQSTPSKAPQASDDDDLDASDGPDHGRPSPGNRHLAATPVQAGRVSTRH